MKKGQMTLLASLLVSCALLAGCEDSGRANDVEGSSQMTTHDREPGTSER